MTGRAVARAVAGSVLSVSAATGFRATADAGGGRRGPAGGPFRAKEAPRLPFFLLGASGDGVDAPSPVAPVPASPDGRVRRLKERFRSGDYYVWLYRDGEGRPTSWERYEVVPPTPSSSPSSTSNDIVIEMSSKFAEDQPWVTHHRMTVDLERHLESYATGREGWRIGFEYLDPNTGEWQPFGLGDNVQAFEEKFDVFSMLGLASADVHERGANSDGNGNDDGAGTAAARVVGLGGHEQLTLTRTDRHRYTEAWYGPARHGLLSGVAVLKDFAEHTFALVRAGRNGNETDFSVHF